MTSNALDAAVGRVLDRRYRVLSHIADGGMASVYVALDERLDREVALKIMRPTWPPTRPSSAGSARGPVGRPPSHPNVVAVYDQGEDEGGMFLAMEFVKGQTLRERIHGGR